MDKFIENRLSEQNTLQIFGEPQHALDLNIIKDKLPDLEQLGQTPVLVKVLGIQGVDGPFMPFPVPQYILMPGEGETTAEHGFKHDGKVRVWRVPKDYASVALHISTIRFSNDTAGGKNAPGFKIRVPDWHSTWTQG